MYTFDELIDRRHTESTKWDRYQDKLQRDDLLPMWLADMDLPASDEIKEALMKRASHPIYGYSDRGRLYYEVFAERFQKQYAYDITADDVMLSTGVLYSIAAAIHLFTNPKDGILLLMPCYHPFVTCVENSDRRVIPVDMCVHDQQYEIDFEQLENRLKKDDTVKALILCNPHNPSGRVFRYEELKRLSEICEKYHLLIISDEIHSDFVYEAKFIPIMKVSTYARQHTIACVSPTKSFNLAGLKVSAILVKNESMKKKLKDYCSLIGISSINIFAMEAVKAAYLKSNDWQQALLTYLKDNRNLITAFVKRHADQIVAFQPQGTYFYWMKFHADIHERLLNEAGLILNHGAEFSSSCAAYERLNFACPRPLLQEGLRRLDTLLKEIENE